MFIYADESGNTGRQIFQDPPFYKVGALLSVDDMEGALRAVIDPLNKANGRERLHAKDLTPTEAAETVGPVLDVLEAGGRWSFMFGEIEKNYVATTKFVDTVFDAGENLAVPAIWYNQRGFRHILCLKMDAALRDRHRRDFWDAYLRDDIVAIQGIVGHVAQFVRTRETDRRLREICKDAFEYVARHPEDFTLSAAKGRRAYQGHTPNMVAFSFLFDAIHRFVEATGSKPVAFVHDRQQEFGASMKEWAELFGKVKRDEHMGIPRFELADYDLPTLSLPSSADVFSLQAVDLLLWIMTRTDQVLQSAQRRLSAHLDPHAISREVSAEIVAEFQATIRGPMPTAMEQQGREEIRRLEADRRARIANRRAP